MRSNNSSRCLPRDWQFFLAWQALPITGFLIAWLCLWFVQGTRLGDPTFLWIASLLAAIGIILLFIARLPLYRQGRFFTFGWRALPEGHRRVYRIAYCFIGVSVAMMLALLAVLR